MYVWFRTSRNTSNVLKVAQVYLNIVLDDALEEKAGGQRERIGMVVIRGNAVVMLEVCAPHRLSVRVQLTKSKALDRINTDDHNKGGRH